MSIENPEISKEYKNINVNLFNVSELERQGIVVMEPKDVKINVKVIGKKNLKWIEIDLQLVILVQKLI